MLTDAEFERFYRDNKDKIKVRLVDNSTTLEFDRTFDEVFFFREPFKTERHKLLYAIIDYQSWIAWNDTPGRTKQEVINLLLDAASLAMDRAE